MLAWKRTNAGIVGVLLVASMILGCVAPASAQKTARPEQFDQPAMPLAEALRQFAKRTGYDVVFPESLVEGRQSAPVRDARNAHHALTQLLYGSALVPRFTRKDAFILERADEVAAADITLDKIEVASSPADAAAYRWYGEKLLERCLSELRRSRDIGLRSYDFTLYVWLSHDGKIESLKGTADTAQEEILGIAATMLKGLVVGSEPPANMPQPVGLRISAQ